jgi:hypothetical protein
MRRREPPFIGGEEGVLVLPSWKVQTDLKPMFRCIELGSNLVNRLWHVGKRQPTQDGAIWADWGWVTSLDPYDLAYVGFAQS